MKDYIVFRRLEARLTSVRVLCCTDVFRDVKSFIC